MLTFIEIWNLRISIICLVGVSRYGDISINYISNNKVKYCNFTNKVSLMYYRNTFDINLLCGTTYDITKQQHTVLECC